MVAIDDNTRVQRDVGRGGVPTVVRVRVPRVDGANGRFALTAAALCAVGRAAVQRSRTAAGYLKILQHRTHAILVL